jgi:tetratricopeptide (TPR) repeat protein
MKNYLLLLVAALVLTGCTTSKVKINPLSEKEIDAQEVKANKAREDFYNRDYQGAVAILEPLASGSTVNTPMYLNELATCYLAAGEYSKAKKTFWRAHDYMEVFDPASEAQASHLFGAEAQKFYHGDPYERAMNNLFLGLLFLKDNDVDNALACFNSGILCDAEVADEKMSSDFFLLYALAAKCYKERKQNDMWQQYTRQARAAFRDTAVDVRQLSLSRQLLETSKANNQSAQEQLVVNFLIEQIEFKLNKLQPSVNTLPVEPLLSGDYNTLIVLGLSPSVKKSRSGQYGEKLEIIEPFKDEEIRYEITIDANDPLDPVQDICDVNYQAMTRGKRLMDEVLRKKATFKRTANNVADILIITGAAMIVAGASSGNGNAAIVFYSVGGGMIASGMIIKGVAYMTVARSDTRCWQTLPGELQLIPLKLPYGRHQIEISLFDGYLKSGKSKVEQINIDNLSKLNVIIAFP